MSLAHPDKSASSKSVPGVARDANLELVDRSRRGNRHGLIGCVSLGKAMLDA